MHKRRERGQAVLLMLVALSLFACVAIGLGIDGSHLYAQRQMAQTAADAAAQAAAMSIFDGTNTSGTNAFSTTAFTCGTTSAMTPCVYARNNGFGGIAADTVSVAFATSAPGVTVSADPVPVVKVTVTRNVSTTLMRWFGPTATAIKATGTAAIIAVTAAPPILVLDPNMANALNLQGNPDITITGGPAKSIQVNSSDLNAVHCGGSASMNLAGSLGTWGGPSSPQCTLPASQWAFPSSPIQDPLAGVPAPSSTGMSAGTSSTVTSGVHGCPVSKCTLYTPGLWSSAISVKNDTGIFQPGVYYMNGVDFGNDANGDMFMATGFADDPNTGQGMVVYLKGAASLNIGKKNSTANLTGAPIGSIYKGILFFQDRSSTNYGPGLGGGGSLTLTGTIYLRTQHLDLQGGPGSSTLIIGEIIVDALALGGNGSITMTLSPIPSVILREVALVN